MRKRGQITLFIIIGLLMFAAFAFVYFIKYLQTERPDLLFSVGLTSEINALKENIDACLEQKTREGINYFGVDDDSQGLIENHIEKNLKDCVNFEAFEELGLDIDAGSVNARVIITDRAVLVDMKYPITITKRDATTKLEQFNYYMQRERRGIFSFSTDQRTTQTKTIVTEDGDAELIIPAGTKITDANGNPITQVSLKILDRNFDGLNNAPLIGMVAYEGLPDGARFEPPVTLTIKYKPSDVLPGVPEESLRIAWFDKEAMIWKSVPSIVDTTLHTVTAKISHFTWVAPAARCSYWEKKLDKTIETTEQVIGGPHGELVFEQTCGESAQDDNGWTDGGSCLDATWEALNVKGFHELDDLGYEQVIDSPNPSPPSGQVTAECVKKDWDEDDANKNGIDDDTECSGGQPEEDCNEKPATPETFGYEENPYSGGYGYITFMVERNGDSCISTDKYGGTEITYEVTCSDGDTCSEENGAFRLHNPEESLDKKTIEDNWAEWVDRSKIQAGENDYWVKVENGNGEGDGCAWAAAKLTITGTGIYWVPKAGLTADCTIQERINFLCKEGDTREKPDYPHCTEAFMNPDYAPELNWLAEKRGANYGDPGYKGDTLLSDTKLNYDDAPKADAPAGCGRGYTPKESCCCDTADTELQNTEHCISVEDDCEGKDPYTVSAPMSACEEAKEEKSCTTSDGMIIEHGKPYIANGNCVVCKNGKPEKADDPKWCAGVMGCCRRDNKCEDKVVFPKCEGDLHTGMYCKDIKECSQYAKKDLCKDKKEGYYCSEEGQYYYCRKDGTIHKDHPKDCLEGKKCIGEGPAGSHFTLCKEEEEKPKFILRDNNNNLPDCGEVGRHACIQNRYRSFKGCCGSCKADGSWDIGWICTRPCSLSKPYCS